MSSDGNPTAASIAGSELVVCLGRHGGALDVDRRHDSREDVEEWGVSRSIGEIDEGQLWRDRIASIADEQLVRVAQRSEQLEQPRMDRWTGLHRSVERWRQRIWG